jgi:hypothetical protein
VPNKWSDDDLKRAVVSSVSWRGTARALGAYPAGGPFREIQKRARELGLDTSHFTGQRQWGDAALREAIPKADSWAAVIRILGVKDSGDIRVYLRGHAVRLGIDISHLNRDMSSKRPAELLPLPSMLRFAAESIATAWFGLRGVPVAAPMQQSAYDLLVTLPDGIKRVQVKSTAFRAKQGSWSAGIGRRPYVLDKTASRTPYDPDDLDYFFIVDGDGLLYFIPIEVVAGRTAINVGAYRDFIVGDASGLLHGDPSDHLIVRSSPNSSRA